MSWSEKILTGDWAATVQSIAGTIAIAVFVVTFLAQAFTIPSESMEQTLLIGDYLLVTRQDVALPPRPSRRAGDRRRARLADQAAEPPGRADPG